MHKDDYQAWLYDQHKFSLDEIGAMGCMVMLIASSISMVCIVYLMSKLYDYIRPMLGAI